MLFVNLFEPAWTEWTALIITAPKKGSSQRFCKDYRKLSNRARRNANLLWRMDKCISILIYLTIFLTLDANSEYWQVRLENEDRDITHFSSTAPLPLSTLSVWLKECPWNIPMGNDRFACRCKLVVFLINLDDISIFSNTLEKQIIKTKQMLALAQLAGVTHKLKWCSFFTNTINFVEHVNLPRRLEIAAHPVDAIQNFETATKHYCVTLIYKTLWCHQILRPQSFVSLRRLAAKSSKQIKVGNLNFYVKKSPPQRDRFRDNLYFLPFWRCYTLEAISRWTQARVTCRLALHCHKASLTWRKDQLVTGSDHEQELEKPTTLLIKSVYQTSGLYFSDVRTSKARGS